MFKQGRSHPSEQTNHYRSTSPDTAERPKSIAEGTNDGLVLAALKTNKSSD